MFERFTDRARRVVVLAQEEVRMLNHNYIGTEHLLLGLIHEGEGVACKALEALGVSLEGVRDQVEEIIGQGAQSPQGFLPFTPRAKKVLEFSLREALQLGHNYIGTEHILLGLIREGQGVAAQVLVKLGCELTRVRQEVVILLSREAEPEEPDAAKEPEVLTLEEALELIETVVARYSQEGLPLAKWRLEIAQKMEQNFGFSLPGAETDRAEEFMSLAEKASSLELMAEQVCAVMDFLGKAPQIVQALSNDLDEYLKMAVPKSQ